MKSETPYDEYVSETGVDLNEMLSSVFRGYGPTKDEWDWFFNHINSRVRLIYANREEFSQEVFEDKERYREHLYRFILANASFFCINSKEYMRLWDKSLIATRIKRLFFNSVKHKEHDFKKMIGAAMSRKSKALFKDRLKFMDVIGIIFLMFAVFVYGFFVLSRPIIIVL